MSECFSLNCRACDRLSQHLDQVKAAHPNYYALPVPAFGDKAAKLLIVGLAPGLHGANRSGRPFTGDHAGILLYQTLYQFGYSSHPQSTSVDDGLVLYGCRITNAVKCLPPQNKPLPAEVRQCSSFLAAELRLLPKNPSILALGAVAHAAVLQALQLPLKSYRFGHGAVHLLPTGGKLYDSYHCSRYNTQTRRLTTEMFQAVFAKIGADHG